MGSSLRNDRDKRYSPSTYRDHRAETQGGSLQNRYDESFTAHSTDFKPAHLDGHESRTDHKVDYVHEMARDWMVPQIQTMSRNALLTDRHLFYYYRRKRTGRRCSCYLYETSPDSGCHVCLGTGIVGGYEKHNTVTEIIDFTCPETKLTNIDLTLGEDTRPVYFRLADGYDSGQIEAVFRVRKNIGKLDTYMLFQPVFNKKTKVFAKTMTIPEVLITRAEDLEPLLAEKEIMFRIFMEKGDERPLVSHFLFRYIIHKDMVVFGDTIRAQENLSGISPVGFIDSYQELEIFFDAMQIKRYENEDILYRLKDNKRFKIISLKENRIAGGIMNTSNDVVARFCLPNIDLGIHNLLV